MARKGSFSKQIRLGPDDGCRHRLRMFKDSHSRSLTNLRISLTDRCNFRYSYYVPLNEYHWTGKTETLTLKEITRRSICRWTDQYSENRLAAVAAAQSNVLSKMIKYQKLEMINLGG